VLCLSPSVGAVEGASVLARLKRTISLGDEIAWDTSERPGDFESCPDRHDGVDRVAKPMLLLASGGSTGIPKLIDAIGAGQFVPGDFLGGLGAALKRRPRARAFICTPLSHGAGAATAYMAMFEQCEATSLERFDAEVAIWAIEKFGAEQLTMVPTMMDRIARSPRFDSQRLQSIRSLTHTGAHIDPAVKLAWIDVIGPEKVLEVYGSTESVGHFVIAGGEWLTHRGSVGRPVNCKVRIIGTHGQDVPRGEVGEIFVKPLVGTVDPATKYIGSNLRMKSHEDYVSFGDLGHLDDEGYLYVAGRTDDLIITGGANVYPDEIEILVRRLPGVADCVVVGLPHADLGQAVHAVISLADGAAPFEIDELRTTLRGQLSPYKMPRSLELVAEIQRTDAGKIRRSRFLARAAAPALTVGDLSPQDDFMHPVSGDPSHNESMFFNFFDARQEIGGFVRIGNRVNEGHAEMTFCMCLPGGDVLLQWGKPKIDSNAAFDAAGMRFAVVEPGRRFRVTYSGSAVRMKDPYEMKDPGRAMRGNPSCDVELDLEVTGMGPMIGSRAGDPRTAVVFLDGVGHYQQALSARGTLSAGSDQWRLSTLGVRDHSWGRRVWSSIYRDRSIWLSFGPELSVIACKTWLHRDVRPDEMGCVIEGDRVVPLRSIRMRSRFKRDSYYHDAVRLELEDIEGRAFVLDGEVLTYVPLRHRTPGHEIVYLGQAMTRFTLDGRTTIGLSEYFDAASACDGLVELSRAGQWAVE
jgi:bile acid-coenzyme A ligase